jgi:hypothetical protein
MAIPDGVAPPGWYPDPDLPDVLRWWDGRNSAADTWPVDPTELAPPTGEGKSRSVAVVMAVFLSFWSFLYTYRTSRWKFWLGFGIVLLSWIIAIVVDIIDSGHSPVTALLVLFVPLGVWIWSIIDRANTRL